MSPDDWDICLIGAVVVSMLYGVVDVFVTVWTVTL